MDHGIEAPERIDLGSDFLGTGDSLEISNYNRLSLRQGASGVRRAFGIAGMEDHPMPLAASSSPASRPRPVLEPEMKMRDIVLSLRSCTCACVGCCR